MSVQTQRSSGKTPASTHACGWRVAQIFHFAHRDSSESNGSRAAGFGTDGPLVVAVCDEGRASTWCACRMNMDDDSYYSMSYLGATCLARIKFPWASLRRKPSGTLDHPCSGFRFEVRGSDCPKYCVYGRCKCFARGGACWDFGTGLGVSVVDTIFNIYSQQTHMIFVFTIPKPRNPKPSYYIPKHCCLSSLLQSVR